MRREIEFQQHLCRNCKKSMREKKNEWCDREGEKKWISIMRLPKFMSCPAPAREVPQCMLGGVPEWFTNCGNQVAKIVGNWERKYELWQPSCWKWEEKKEKKKRNCGCRNLGEELKKNKVLCPQYFYNKSQVISCY